MLKVQFLGQIDYFAVFRALDLFLLRDVYAISARRRAIVGEECEDDLLKLHQLSLPTVRRRLLLSSLK